MNQEIGAWTVYDLMWFLLVWEIMKVVVPLVLRDVIWPTCLVVIRWVRRGK